MNLLRIAAWGLVIAIGCSFWAPADAAQTLVEASTAGDIGRVKVLLQSKNVNVEVKDPMGNTALIGASRGGYLAIVQALIAAHADVNGAAGSGFTALAVAAQGGHLEVVRALLAANARTDAEALAWAAMNGHLDIVRSLLDAHAEIDAPLPTGLTALMMAAWRDHLPVVQALVDAHANLNASDVHGVTALMEAAARGHLDVVKALIDAHADVNAKTIKGATAILMATTHNYPEVAQALAAAGAATAPVQGETELGSCGPTPTKAESVAVAIGVIRDGRETEFDLIFGNAKVAMVVDPRKLVQDQSDALTIVGVTPDGPTFIWVAKSLTESTRLQFKEARIDVQQGQVYLWKTTGKKTFPKDALHDITYLCDYDQMLDDNELGKLFLKAPTPEPHSNKTEHKH